MVVEANLPDGVITNNTEGVSGDISRIDVLTVEELAMLWRVYSNKQKLLANDVGRRLENFFWRVWSVEAIRTTIRGSQVAVMFEEISQGNIIRTTPTSSPRNSRLYDVAGRVHAARPTDTLDIQADIQELTSVTNRPLPVSVLEISESRQPTPTPASAATLPVFVPLQSQDLSLGPEATRKHDERADQERSRPPPILKKPGSDSGSSSKTARIQAPSWKSGEFDPDHDEPLSPQELESKRNSVSSESTGEYEDANGDPETPSAGSDTSDLPSPSIGSNGAPTSAKMSRTGSGQGSSGSRNRKKTSFMVASRRRPVMTRRLISQNVTQPGSGPKEISPGLNTSRRASEEIASLSSIVQPMSRTTSGTGMSSKANRGDAATFELCTSRSHSPVSESPFRRTGKDHEQSKIATPSALHQEVTVLLAAKREFVPLNDTPASDMRRSISGAGVFSGAPSGSSSSIRNSTSSTALAGGLPKSKPANTSSSNLAATGTMTPTLGTTPTQRASMFGRVNNLFAGSRSGRSAKDKTKPAFDIGPDEDENFPAEHSSQNSLASSLDTVRGTFPSTKQSKLPDSEPLQVTKSQTQLSALLDQERKKDTERDRRRSVRGSRGK